MMCDDVSTPPRFAILREGSPRRDLLSGPPSLQERHRLAREWLMAYLLLRSDVQACMQRSAEEGAYGAAVQAAIQALEDQARAAGLPSRTALLLQQLMRYEAQRPPAEPWADDHPELAEFAAFLAPFQEFENVTREFFHEEPLPAAKACTVINLMTLTEGLTQRLGLTGDWLTRALVDWILHYTIPRSIFGIIGGAWPVYRVEPVDSVDLHIEGLPANASAAEVGRRAQAAHAARLAQWCKPQRGRMPKRSAYIERNVGWLLRHSLDNISIGQLAREYVATREGLAGDGRSQVREGIEWVRTWLNAVELVTVTEIRTRKPRHRARRQSRRRTRR